MSLPLQSNQRSRTADPKLIFESGSPGRSAVAWPRQPGKVEDAIPASLLRRDIAGFPELGELEVLRHFTRLSQRNFAIESQFYPLGSCTMKYNPKINEIVARLPGFAQVHPLAPPDFLQGALAVLYDLEAMLAEISGMEHVSLQPSAGAQGELTGLMLIRACLTEKGDPRKKIIVPDTAHGTNPASSTLCGYDVIQISSNERGVIDAAAVEKAMDEDVAAVMITNPNTLGLFETNIEAVAEVVHAKGGMRLSRRRQSQRADGHRQAGTYGHRCLAHESAQDLFDPPRRRRAGCGTGGRESAARATICRRRASSRAATIRVARRLPEIDWPGALVLRQLRDSRARLYLYSFSRRRRTRRGEPDGAAQCQLHS